MIKCETMLCYVGGKSNGVAVPITLRNRPRIPTPDVAKEVLERDRLAVGVQNMGVIMAQGYQSEVPVLGALVLSPIQELDSGSVNNTLHAGQPGTAALAQAVLGGAPVALSPVALARAASAPGTPRAPRSPAPPSDTPSDRDTAPDSSKRGEVYV